jgi:hypothetical protein
MNFSLDQAFTPGIRKIPQFLSLSPFRGGWILDCMNPVNGVDITIHGNGFQPQA